MAPAYPYTTDDGGEGGSESRVYHTVLRHQKQLLHDVHSQQVTLDSEYRATEHKALDCVDRLIQADSNIFRSISSSL